MPRSLLVVTAVALALCAMSVGAVTVARASSAQCQATFKWNGSESNPHYQWILTGPPENQTVSLCPSVTCNNPQKICLTEIGFPEPPNNAWSHWCDCNDTPPGQPPGCTAVVNSTSGPWGPISSVNCTGACPPGQGCLLTTISPRDPNGWYSAQCNCR